MMRIKSSFFDSGDVGICSGGFPFTYLAQRDVRDGVTDVGGCLSGKSFFFGSFKVCFIDFVGKCQTVAFAIFTA
jgi:hypothetical protein